MRTLGLPIALIMSSWLLLNPMSAELEVNADTERDLFRAAAVVEQGQIPTNGPAIDHLPLTLGPFWYIATAPALAVNKAPYSVHFFHVILLCFGLYLLFGALERTSGVEGALVIAILLGTSSHLTNVLSQVWHNAMLPGMSLIWFWLLYRAVAGVDVKQRSSSLAWAWLVTALMLQLHTLAVAYLPSLVIAQFLLTKNDGFRSARLANSFSFLIAAVLILGYSYSFASLNWDAVRQLHGARASTGGSLTAVLVPLPQHLSSGWSTVFGTALGWVVITCASLGALFAFVGATPEVLHEKGAITFSRLAVIQTVVGICVVTALSGIDTAARYYNAFIFGMYILASYGIGVVLNKLRLISIGALLAIAAGVTALWGNFPPSERFRDDTTLTLSEQTAVITTLANEYNLSYRDLSQRVHGAVFGPLTATRYLAWAQGMTENKTDHPKREFVVWPTGTIPVGKSATIQLDGGRSIKISEQKPRKTGDVEVTVGKQKCPITLPYRWSHLRPDELKPFGLRPSLDLDRCGTENNPIKIRLSKPDRKAAFTLILMWYDLSRNYDKQVRVEAHGGTVTPVENETLKDMALFEVRAGKRGPLTIEISPSKTLAVIDLY